MLVETDVETPAEVVNRFLHSAPVDLDAMARALRLEVVRDAALPDDISGSIVRNGSKFRISINARHSDTRQRFTLAHEIAHYVLHRDLIGDGITDNAMYRSRLSNELETQANRFAANILMPPRLVRQIYIADGIRDLASLTDRFKVSEEAMRIRLRGLRFAA